MATGVAEADKFCNNLETRASRNGMASDAAHRFVGSLLGFAAAASVSEKANEGQGGECKGRRFRYTLKQVCLASPSTPWRLWSAGKNVIS